jgi:pimeloyl-ACP methyl ester carboxylesterase
VNGELVQRELESFASTPSFPGLLQDLAYGPVEEGPAAPGSGPVTIGWGRHDRVCLPLQAERAQAAFPEARLVWFDHSGHFPMWDEPDRAISLILESTGG